MGPEGFDLDLAVDDQTQRHRLNPACRARAGQLAPQDGRQGKSDQIVQSPPRQIGVNQLHIDVARVLHRLGDGRLGDGVEHHPLDIGGLENLFLPQNLEHVPRDGLTLTVGVGGEDQGVGTLHGIGNIGQTLGRLAVHFPTHGEVIIRLDRAILRGQVAHMAVAGQDDIVRAEILVDGFGLGRTLDDDDVHSGINQII